MVPFLVLILFVFLFSCNPSLSISHISLDRHLPSSLSFSPSFNEKDNYYGEDMTIREKINLETKSNTESEMETQTQQTPFIYHHIDMVSRFGLNTEMKQTRLMRKDQLDGLVNVSSSIVIPSDVLIGCPSYTFWVPVTIGSTTFRLILDTGSTTLGVVGGNCDTCLSVSPQYSPSRTSLNQNFNVSAVYGDGAGWSAAVYSDRVQVGDNAELEVSMKLAVIFTNTAGSSGQGFFTPNAVCPSNPASNSYQGIIGFAFPPLALSSGSSSTDSFLALFASSSSSLAIFGLQLCSSTGKLWLGSAPDTAYMQPNSALEYVRVIQETYWVVQLQQMMIATTIVNVPASTYGVTILDTGTTNMVLGAVLYDAITSSISSLPAFTSTFPSNFFTTSQYVQLPSSQLNALNSALPTLSFTFESDTGGTTTLTVSALSSYLRADVQGSIMIVYNGLQRVGTAAPPNPQTILGWAFLNQFTMAFDLSSSVPRVGFAPTRYCDTLAPPAVISVSWSLSSWSLCNCLVSPRVQYRNVECLDNAGLYHADSACSATVSKPVSVQVCSNDTVCEGAPENGPSDPCAGIVCQFGSCQSGICKCYNGYAGPLCTLPPLLNVTNVTYDKSNDALTVQWSSIGGFQNINLFMISAINTNNTEEAFAPSFPSTWPIYFNRRIPSAFNPSSADGTTSSVTLSLSSSSPPPLSFVIGGPVYVGASYDNSALSIFKKKIVLRADSCASVSCGPYGTCFNGTCVCAPAYTGSHCDQALSPSPSSSSSSSSSSFCSSPPFQSAPTTCTNSYVGANCDIPTTILQIRLFSVNASALSLLTSSSPPSFALLSFLNTLLIDLQTSLNLSPTSTQPAIYIQCVVPDVSTSSTSSVSSVIVSLQLVSATSSALDLASLKSLVVTQIIGEVINGVHTSSTFSSSSSASSSSLTTLTSGIAGGYIDVAYTISSSSSSSSPSVFSLAWLEANWIYLTAACVTAVLIVTLSYYCCCRTQTQARQRRSRYDDNDGFKRLREQEGEGEGHGVDNRNRNNRNYNSRRNDDDLNLKTPIVKRSNREEPGSMYQAI